MTKGWLEPSEPMPSYALGKQWFTCMHMVKLGDTLALTLQFLATLMFMPNFGNTFTLARKPGTTLTLRLDNVITLLTCPFTYNYSTRVTTLIDTIIVHFFNGLSTPPSASLMMKQTPNTLSIGIVHSCLTTM